MKLLAIALGLVAVGVSAATSGAALVLSCVPPRVRRRPPPGDLVSDYERVTRHYVANRSVFENDR